MPKQLADQHGRIIGNLDSWGLAATDPESAGPFPTADQQDTSEGRVLTSECPAPISPVDSFREAAVLLRRPFTDAAVKWKVQADFGESGLIVPYIDARLVIERLNLIVPGLWFDDYEPLAGGQGLLCRLTIDGITRLDVGSGYKGKGLYSDAFKRAAVKFGVGVSLYALPKIILESKEGYLRKQGKKESLVLTDKGLQRCRSGYRAWLKEAGKNFGEDLDHGDVWGAYGDVDAQESISEGSEFPVEDQPAPLEDAKAKALIQAARDLHKEIPAKEMSKAAFERQLAGVVHSHEDLEKFVALLEGMQP